jgi:hypothetical protein
MKKNDTKPFNIPINVKVAIIVLALYGAIALVTAIESDILPGETKNASKVAFF